MEKARGCEARIDDEDAGKGSSRATMAAPRRPRIDILRPESYTSLGT